MDANTQQYIRTITVDWPKMQEAQAKKILIDAATEGNKQIIRDQTSRAGVAPEVETFVNGNRTDDLGSVKLPGPITFLYRYHNEIIKEAIKLLEAASPVDSGNYKRNHNVYVNGTPSHPDVKFQAGDSVMIVNPVPYARVLEIGKTKSGRDFLISVPNRIYERVAGQLNQRYGKVVGIEMKFVGLDAVSVVGDEGTRRVKTGRLPLRGRSRKRSRGPANLFPAILIETRT